MNKPEEERNDSFYVKLKMEDGKTRTLWRSDWKMLYVTFRMGSV